MANQQSQQIEIDLSSAINLSKNKTIPSNFTGFTKKDCVITENLLRKYSLKLSETGYYKKGDSLYRNGSLYKDYTDSKFLHSSQFDDDVIYATFNSTVRIKGGKLLLTYMGNNYTKSFDISKLSSFQRVIDTGEKALYIFSDSLYVFDDGVFYDATPFLSRLAADMSRDDMYLLGDDIVVISSIYYIWHYKTSSYETKNKVLPSSNASYGNMSFWQVEDKLYMTYLGINAFANNSTATLIQQSGTIATRWTLNTDYTFSEVARYSYTVPSSLLYDKGYGWGKVMRSKSISTRYYKYTACNLFYGNCASASTKEAQTWFVPMELSSSDYLLNRSHQSNSYMGVPVDTEGYPLFNLVKIGNFELAYIADVLMFVEYNGYQLTPYGEVDEENLSFAGNSFVFKSTSGKWYKYSVSDTGLIMNIVDENIYTNVIGIDNAVIDSRFYTYGIGFVPLMTVAEYSVNNQGVRNTLASWVNNETSSGGYINPSNYSTSYQFLIGVNPLPDVTKEIVYGPVYNVIMRLPKTVSSSYIQSQLLGFYRFHTQTQKGLKILAYYTNGKDFSGSGTFVFSSIIGTGGTSGYYAVLKDTEIGLSEPNSYSISLVNENVSIKSLTVARQYIYKSVGSSVLLSVDSDRNMLTGYNANNSISDIEDLFVISGMIYGIIKNSLYSMSYNDSNMLVPDQYVLSTKGLRLLGAGTQEALFLSETDGKILSFNGTNTLSITGEGTGLGESLVTGFNVPVNMINIADGNKIYFLGDNRMYEGHLNDKCVSFSDGVFYTASSSYEIDYKAEDGMIDIQTMWYQLEDHRLFNTDCVYITLYDEQMKDGFIEVTLDTYLSGKTSSQTKRIDVKKRDFDPVTNTAYIRYQPKWQNGSMTRFSLKGSYSLMSLSMGVTLTVKEISKVNI